MFITEFKFGTTIQVVYVDLLCLSKMETQKKITFLSSDMPSVELSEARIKFMEQTKKTLFGKASNPTFEVNGAKIDYIVPDGSLADITVKCYLALDEADVYIKAQPTISFDVKTPKSDYEKTIADLLCQLEKYVEGDRAQGTLNLEEKE